jgi:hypothetical protein
MAASSALEIFAATKLNEQKATEITKMSVLNDILNFNFARVPRKQVRLKKLRALTYDESVVAPTENRPQLMKALIYCSADDTLHMIEREVTVDFARLTSSASATYKKIMRFRSYEAPTAILANTWRDAAGIDFKMATDMIIINYIEATSVVQQMIARLLRIGRTTRARIWLLSYTNEMDRWLNSFVSEMAT